LLRLTRESAAPRAVEIRTEHLMPSRDVRRILIVEDEQSLAYLLAQTFLAEPADYEVVTAGTAEEALELVSERPFGVVLADMVLPKMNGLELLERVRLMQPETRVIIMSAYGTDEVRDRATALGAFGYMDKPFPLPKLKGMVMRAFGPVDPDAPPAPSSPGSTREEERARND
jgi:DNA-binding NtrC family response regulator